MTTKVAAGDAQTFESSLASIGRSVMASKCPALFKHEIGFQVLDSDDDNTRAVGVFGFRVGSRILYAPLFYRDGRVKGTEQLRDPKRGITVPMTDNWVNKLLADNGDDDSERISRSMSKGTSQPSFWQLKYPLAKYSGDKGWVDAARKDLARAIGRRPNTPSADLDLIKAASADPAVFGELCDWVVRYPWFGDAVAKMHGRTKLASAVEKMKSAPRPKPVRVKISTITPRLKRAGGVMVVRVRSVDMSSGPLNKALDFFPQDIDDLKAGKNLYRDERPDEGTSKITAWMGGNQADGTTVSNPTGYGIYKVLGADFKVHECAVLFPLVGWDRGQSGDCLVVRLKDKAHAYTNRNAVWAVGEAEPTSFGGWVDSLPEVGESLPEGDKIVALTPVFRHKAHATVPFVVYDADTGEAQQTCGCGGGGEYDTPYWNKKPHQVSASPFAPRTRRENSPRRARVSPNPGIPVLSGNCLYVPKNARILKVGDGDLHLASGTDPDYFLENFKKASVAEDPILTVGTGSGRFYVDDPRSGDRVWYHGKPEAEEALVVGHGFKVAEARKLVDSAETHKSESVAVKYAAPYQQGLSNDWPNAPSSYDEVMEQRGAFADDIVPTESSSSIPLTINDLAEQPGTIDRYRPYPMEHGVDSPMDGVGNANQQNSQGPSEGDMATVSRAAETGRRELFDTAALAALIKHTSIRRMLEEVTPRVSKCVSDLADMLAHLYWNVDEWTEQFGESEVGPLEDQMRDLFDGLGELYLTLQEKRVDDPRDHGILPEAYSADGGDAKA